MSSTERADTAAAFGELGQLLGTAPPLQTSLLRVAELVRRTISGVAGSSITVITEDRGPYTMVFAGRLAIDLDERQYDNGFGPCLDAARRVQTVVVDHRDADSPYGEFSAIARSAGVSHTVSIGLPLGQPLVAGLNVYARSELDRTAVERAETFAGYAAAAVEDAVGAGRSRTSALARPGRSSRIFSPGQRMWI
jgi:hypothetical protein